MPEALCISPDLFLLQQMNLQNIYLAEISMETGGLFCTGRHICLWESLKTGTVCVIHKCSSAACHEEGYCGQHLGLECDLI